MDRAQGRALYGVSDPGREPVPDGAGPAEARFLLDPLGSRGCVCGHGRTASGLRARQELRAAGYADRRVRGAAGRGDLLDCAEEAWGIKVNLQ